MLMCHFLFLSSYIVKAFFISRFVSHCWPKRFPRPLPTPHFPHPTPDVDSESFDMRWSVSILSFWNCLLQEHLINPREALHFGKAKYSGGALLGKKKTSTVYPAANTNWQPTNIYCRLSCSTFLWLGLDNYAHLLSLESGTHTQRNKK